MNSLSEQKICQFFLVQGPGYTKSSIKFKIIIKILCCMKVRNCKIYQLQKEGLINLNFK